MKSLKEKQTEMTASIKSMEKSGQNLNLPGQRPAVAVALAAAVVVVVLGGVVLVVVGADLNERVRCRPLLIKCLSRLNIERGSASLMCT